MGGPVAPEQCHLKDRRRAASPVGCSTSGSPCGGWAEGEGTPALCHKHNLKAQAGVAGECHNFHLIPMIYLIPVLIPFLLTIKDFLLIKSCSSSLSTNEELCSGKNSAGSTGTRGCILTLSFPLLIASLGQHSGDAFP